MPEPAVAPPEATVPPPADPSGMSGLDAGTDQGVLNQASQMANAQQPAQTTPPPQPLHSRIAEGIIHAFAGTDGTAGSALRSALAGGLAGLAAASNRPPGNVPRGAAALGGFGAGATAAVQQSQQQQQQKLENQRQQTAQQMEKTRQDYLNAETQARTVADQKTANKLDEEDMATRVKSGQAAASAYSNHREPLGQGLTAEEIYPEAGEGGKYDHSKVTAFQTGTKEVLENGQTHTVPTFSIYPRSAEQVTVTPELSSVLKEGGYDYKEGTKIDGDLLDSLTTKSMQAQTSAALLKKAANDAKMSEQATEDALQKRSDLAAVNPYLGAHAADPLSALESLSQQMDPKTKQPTPAAQAASRLLSSYDQKELETHRHNVQEEQNKKLEEQNKAAELKQRAGQDTTPTPQTDVLGGTFTPPPGGAKETNKRADSFKKDADALAKTEGTYNQFQDVLNDINSGKPLTGAQSVVALFNAIGISAEPLQGKGFRINNNTVEEHAEARGLGESLYQKFLHLKQGDVITPRQIQDYANIAMRSRHDAYVNKINEARGQGVNPEFLLPRGNGKAIDSNSASIFYDAATGQTPQEKAANAKKAATATGWNF